MPEAPPDFAPARGAQADPSASGAKTPPQRCRLSLLFCDLCDSTALSNRLEGEDYAELLATLRRAGEAVVARHGGTVVRFQGDGMLAVFGHPLPREGDGRRAVEAALELHEAARKFAVPAAAGLTDGLRVHSGVHAGLVLVQSGDDVVGRLELLGAVPNIAARLSSEAGRDELLVSDETLGPGRAYFRSGPARELRVQGQEQALTCRPIHGRVVPATPIDRRLAASFTGFVGRQAEMQRLETRLGEVLAGATCQVALAGPPGVGKTRLATEFVRRAELQGCRVLKGYCDSELDAVPLQPVLQMLRGALGLPADAPVVAALSAVGAALDLLDRPVLEDLGAPLRGPAQPGASAVASTGNSTPGGTSGGTIGGENDHHSPGSDPQIAIARLFARLAGREPLLLFADDWHWADAASRQALAAICAAVEGHGLMVVYSTRTVDPGDASMRQVEVLPLEPLSQEEGRQSIRALLPNADPFITDEIYRYSGGNPLFIEELCHSAAHEQVRLAGQHAGSAWLQELIESRVARLPPERAALVRTLAIIGNVVPAALLTAVTGLAADDEALHDLAQKDFLFPAADGTLRFKHGLTRDVIYESVGLHERRRLHGRVAEALRALTAPGSDHPHEALAYHYGAAGRGAESAHHAELAGDRAASLSALDRAKALYHAALDRLRAGGLAGASVERWLAITHKLGPLCVFDGSRADLPVFERAVQLAQAHGDPALHARAEHWLGYVHYALGQVRDAVRHSERALNLAQPIAGTESLALQIRASLGQAMAAASDYAGAQPLLQDAVNRKRGHRRGTRLPVVLAYSLVCLASVAGDRGQFARAHALMDEAWALLHGATHEIGASITGWRAVILGWQGRWPEALAAAEVSTRIAEQTHSLFQFCQGRATGAYAEWVLTGEASAIDRLAESTQWLEPRESGLFRSLDHGWLTEGWLARGDRVRARRHGALALQRARAGDLIGVALGCRALAREAARAGHAPGQRDDAAKWLARARRIAAQRDSAHEAAANDLCAAEVALHGGDLARARELAEAAAAAFERLEMRWHRERAEALLAQA